MAEFQENSRTRFMAAERKRAKMKNKLNYRPIAYPHIQPRGYYSDIITNETKEKSSEITKTGPHVHEDTLWTINTNKYSPNVSKLQISQEEVEKQLENQIYGLDTGVFTKKRKVGESCVSGVDFSAVSFLPKVQLATGHTPGQKPRNIEMERLRRMYARLDITTLLKERGIDVDLLMPKQQTNLNVILMQDPADPAPFPPYLPLHIFDNTEFDGCTPEEWMRLGETTLALRPIPAVCLLPEIDSDKYKEPTDPSIKYKWFDAGVLDYCRQRDMYYVQKVDENCRVLDPDGNRVVNRSIDPVTGQRIRLPNHFWVGRLRCMFRAEDPRLFADRINFAFRIQEANKKLLKEITMEYCWVMNRFILDEEVRNKPATFAFVTIPPKHETVQVPQNGCIEVPEYDYKKQSDSFAYSSIYTSKKSVHAMRLVRAECNTLLNNMSFFNFKLNKMFRLEEFETLQAQTTTMASNYLREIWVNNLKLHIRRSFMDVRRGWFNIYETDWRIYQISKMKKLMEVIKFTMQDTLRFMVMESLNSLTRHILDYCYSTMHCRKGYKWGKSLIESPFPPRRIPTMFAVDLVLDSRVHYSINRGLIASVMDNLFVGAINGAQSVLQLEVLIMQDIFWAESPTLESVCLNEEPVRALRKIISGAIESSLIPLTAYAKKYESFLDVMNLDIKQFSRDLEEKNPTARDIEKEVARHMDEKDKVMDILPYNIIIGPFFVNTELVRDQITAKRQELVKAGLTLLARRLRTKIDELADEFKEMMGAITDVPNCIESLFALREWINELTLSLDKSRDKINVLLQDFVVLDENCFNLSDEDFIAKVNLIAWPAKIEDTIAKKLAILEVDEDRYLKQLDSDTFILNERIDNAQISVAAMAEFHDLGKVHEYANEMRRMAKNLRECQDLSTLYNSREKLFKMKPTSYARLGKLTKEFEPFRKLWITASDWQRLHEGWLSDPLSAIHSEELERCVTDSFKTMHKFSRFFASVPAVQEVAVTIRTNIEAFKPYVPLIQAMTNPGLKDRHWELLSDACNMKLRPSPTLTFTKCLEMGLDHYTEPISKISDVAAKEYAIEVSLNKMEAEWENMEFEVIPYRNTGTYMLKAGEEIAQQIDDHIVLTQSMTFSPFKKPFEERIADWEATLKLTQEVMEVCLAVQRSWLYLEPIFTSDDITKQLPTEASRFQTMTRIWRKVMRNAKATPQVIKLCPDETMLADLTKCGDLLDHVQKGLSDYLETKRSRFPRFFFLSDDELLEVLSQTKDPTAVQPHLRKCFENISSLKFEENNRISLMRSGEGEAVNFFEELYPYGNVEDWLSEIERVMRDTIRHVISLALPNYLELERTEWVLKWPGQVVIAVCQTYWSAEVAEALQEHEISEYFDKILLQLDGLRNLVRQDISRIGRMTLSALIVIEVHARDVVETLLREEVQDANAFEWISQLRYYWKEDNNLYQKAVNAEFPYGYEYLGNTPRLVITPLTDRCYLTLTGALNLLFGGAPAGPAGTGKTETTKDLGKAFAIQCVVFNCSDQLDFMAMGKFFKGLASAGAWACFDEFNRIDIEVLSVVAQQIATIQNAQRMQLDVFMFEGLEIVLKPSCAVFITMNPGYAGRTELPDNLKALFRPVAMMVPDYALIAEISLFSFGFGEARVLAKKIVTTFKLSSEQLSTQDHYDFGMRAVKSVISAAGNLKRMYLDMNEQLICLRAIRDVNVPKFLADDLKLFNGIVSDLFPNIKEEAIDYGSLDTSLRSNCEKDGILDTEEFIHKCIQLYETTVVRHGLMLVGTAGAGKTKCYKTLQAAQTELKGLPNPSMSFFCNTHTYILNPKSITMGQLYGEFDPYTHEWTDGILSTLIRVGTTATDDDKRWYVFDGPVDAVWIENMNTVLDDNKKLCLSSGEIIKLTDNMTMMFEVADLAVASPATVSRCGMVYLGTNVVGISPIVSCWLKTLPQTMMPHADQLQELFDFFLMPGLAFVRSDLTEVVGTLDSCLVFGLLNILTCFISPLKKQNLISEDMLPMLANLMEPWFIFSFVWSIGASCDNKGRHKISDWLREKMKEYGIDMLFPDEGMVYDYRLDEAGVVPREGAEEEEEEEGIEREIRWINWMVGRDVYEVTSEMSYSDIMVPTIDTIRSTYLINMFALNKKKLLIVGTTGTGKTLTVLDKLTRGLPDVYLPEFINFSAKTSSNQTQDLIDGKLDKRRKGIYGPPIGRYSLFFVDDLNMPALETYGAQPPIELIRQYMDFGGWYDRKAIGEFRTLVDVNVMSAMGPPGGGRNPVTARLLRHFNFLVFTEMESDSMFHIFKTILHFWISNCADVVKYCEKIVKASIEVYYDVQANMLPTPAKSHYTFNLRDLSKVFQGMLMGDHEENKSIKSTLRLWYHESCRVFQDRLVDDADRKQFEDLITLRIKQIFKLEPEKVIKQRPVLYADFMNTESDPRPYLLIDDFTAAQKSLEDNLSEYNQVSTKKMPLVIFKDALVHICRITRVLRQPQGNALLLGMGGSGRQSLTRLSAFVAEYDCFQIELAKNYGPNEWHEDLKKVMMKAGLKDEVVVFLFSDTQIKSESFLEDLNNILNTGDVPNLYGFDEMENIFKVMKPVVMEKGLPPTKAVMFSTYTKKVKSNLHTVITMSPLGEIFRARLRQFPALVNCCTIDWFSEWPTEALQSVALRFLNDTPDLIISDEVTHGLVALCQEIHESVSTNSIRYLEEMSRYNYVTPTSFLELLGIYSMLISSKKRELVLSSQRLKTGLDKINSTTVEVARLQEELEAMSPELEKAVGEATVTMEQIAKDTAVAEVTKNQVQVEERAAQEKAMETEAIAMDAQKDLDEALPALEAALSSLKSLNKNDVIEVRALQRPPMGVKLVMEAVCIMKQLKPKKVAGEKPGQKVDDYWDVGKTLLTEPQKFLDSLFTYDRDNIPAEVIKKIAAYSENPSFTPEAISKVSKACTSLCQWVLAMEKYHFVAVTVAPKREKLRVAKEELEATEKILNAAKARLYAVEAGVAALQSKYNVCMNKKQTLEDKCKLCVARLDRADKLIKKLGRRDKKGPRRKAIKMYDSFNIFRRIDLINSLADEKGRWGEAIEMYDSLIVNVPGDILISAGFISYLGPFTNDYRHQMVRDWTKRIKELDIPSSAEPTLINTMSDPVKIRNWQICGLPGDSYSVENGVIVSLSRRWPLFIDPQGQANKWTKNMEASNELDVIKQSSKDLIRSLENAIRFGKSCLMENVGSDLDPALDPVLLRQTYKQQGNLVIKMGDNIIPYHQDFKFFMTTKLPNPHYTPEVSIKVALINFTLSPSGLEEQLLGTVVAEERPDLEELKNQLIVNNAQMKGELKAIEDKILYLLSASQGSPVDDLDLIETLDASKITSTEIYHKMITTEETEKNIDQIRSRYIPVATNAQVLFFCVGDMAKVDPMYQYSLEWFIKIFLSGIAQAERGESLEQRVVNINECFTFNLFINVCRSLFEKHKLLFGLLMCVRLEMQEGKIDMDEWRWMIAGGTIVPKELPNPDPSWLSARSWNDILTLQALPTFESFAEDFDRLKDDFMEIFDSNEPQEMTMPDKWDTLLDEFQSILVLKALRPDKVTNAFQNLVASKLGQQFIEPHQTDLGEVYKDSSASTPLVFVLSTGTDPAKSLYAFAASMKCSERLNAISLGQGQGPIAEHLMRQAMERGGWVFFQNCHLAPSWMPRLERLVEQIDPDTVHKDFRLWLTSMPSPNFPVYILQNSSKMTVEPPKGIKANLLRSYLGFNDKFLKHCVGKTKVFKYLLLSICIFHAVCLERRKFGALGFNIPYEFTDGDLRICIDQLSMFLQEYSEIPFKVLVYTAGHINYGGRITDDWDRRCLMNILEDFYNAKVIFSNYCFSGVYHQLPPDAEINGYLDYIRSLPINDTPEIFGLHDNANITFAQNETSNLLGYLVDLQPKTSAGKGHSREEVMEGTANSILSKVPHPVDFKVVTRRFPVKYEQSMNTVIAQEVIRYNRLLTTIRHSLQELLKALKGWVVMSQQLENMANSLFVNVVPAMWASKAYPSLKPLGAWVHDLEDRMHFIQKWVEEDTPPVFWISGFFFPQAFLTGTLQNFARLLVISIDRIGFDFQIMPDLPTEPPSKGCYINGLFLEGARWDYEKGVLTESRAKELYTDMPVVWLIPIADKVNVESASYECPVYKTLTRAGTLSTTGHSTNFVFTIRLPSDQPEKHWIKQGVALMCALNF